MKLTRGRLALLIIFAIPVLQIGLILFSGIVSSVLGCSISGGGPERCVIHGVDIGSTLYSMAFLGYYGFLIYLIYALPLISIAVGIWLIVSWRKDRRRRAIDPNAPQPSTVVQITTRKLGYALGAIVAVALLPYAIVVGSSLFAAVLGCKLDVDSGIHECVVMGLDLGRALYVVNGVGFFLAIPFVPFAAMAFLIWLVVAGRYWMRRWSIKTS